MLDHIGISVTDLNRSTEFYSKALAPLAIKLIVEITPEQSGSEAHAGFGADEKAFFWIGTGKQASGPLHLSFVAQSRADVDAFYQCAMAAGGKDNGVPGIRSHYHPNYYGGFVIDPDGNNIEAVCHAAK